jgi:16S rRNA (cytosine967-C5)-methyltransferase
VIEERRILQLKILNNCAALLKPGGTCVYATCTTEPEENESVVTKFLSGTDNEFMIDDPRPYLPEQARSLIDGQGFFHTYPQVPEMDGFFGVRMVRKK